MTESKYKSKGVPTLEITDELSKSVSDMGLIVSDNDGKGNCLFVPCFIGTTGNC